MVFVIRRAEARDAPAIAAIWNDVIRQTTMTFTTTLKDPQDLARQMMHDPFVVAETERTVAGFATAGPFRKGPGYATALEHSLYVAPEAQGQGMGAALLGAIEVAAKAQGARHLVAGISGENPRAVAFHARHGFEQVGLMPGIAQKFGRTLDLVLMQKILSA